MKTCLFTAIACIAVGVIAAQFFPQCPFFSKKKVKTYTNKDFYVGDAFQPNVAKRAYLDLMARFGVPKMPIHDTENFWVAEFGQNDFSRVGMGGIFWVNENYQGGGFLGHEIYLLPGQMIVEHAHVKTDKGPAKREAWLVRNGSCYSFSVQDDAAKHKAAPNGLLPESQLVNGGITCNSWKLLKAGDVDVLNKEGYKHFLIAGPEGAIVTEYGNFHDNDGLRFTAPGAKL